MIDHLIGSVVLVLGTAGAAVIFFIAFRAGRAWARHALAAAKDLAARARALGRAAFLAYIAAWIGLFPAMLILCMALAMTPGARRAAGRHVRDGANPNGYRLPVGGPR